MSIDDNSPSEPANVDQEKYNKANAQSVTCRCPCHNDVLDPNTHCEKCVEEV